MWCSNITLDKEAPQLIHGIIMDNLAEIYTRADVADVVGDHSELFRKSQAAICYMRDFNAHLQVPGCCIFGSISIPLKLNRMQMILDAIDGNTTELMTLDDESGPVTNAKWVPMVDTS
nr:Phox-associated domain-containing protein [Tanacetum cinerariifolium]